MRILITGATGLVGGSLLPRLLEAGHEAVAVTRRDNPSLPPGCRAVKADPAVDGPWLDEIDSCDAVVHLAGENVFAKRWSTRFKKQLYDSRVNSTRLIAERLARKPTRSDGSPRLLVSASAVGYYGPHEDTELVEDDPPGTDFLAEICIAWEQAANPARAAGVRVVNPRVGMVLAPNEGALKKLLLPFKLFIGGPVGDGKQWISWIHIDDVVGFIMYALATPTTQGAYNATAPEPLTNWGFSKTLATVLRRPCWLPVPRWALRILLGEVASVVTKGQRAIPQRAVQAGYSFIHPDLEEALRHLLKRPLAQSNISG